MQHHQVLSTLSLSTNETLAENSIKINENSFKKIKRNRKLLLFKESTSHKTAT